MISFSIIIPVYNILESNSLQYFDRLIYSIYCNLKIDFVRSCFKEVIIINDNPDQSVEKEVSDILNKYHVDKYKIYTNHKNCGQAFSRNRGASFAVGDYLHFIDQDDFVSDCFYERILLRLSNHKEKVIISKLNLFYSDSSDYFDPYRKLTLKLYNNSKSINDLKIMMLSNIANSPGGYLIERKLFLDIGGYVNLNNYGTDDWGLFYKLICQGDISLSFCKDAIFYYRIHPNQNIKKLNMKASLREQFLLIRKMNKICGLYYYMLYFFKLNFFGRYLNAFLYKYIFWKVR